MTSNRPSDSPSSDSPVSAFDTGWDDAPRLELSAESERALELPQLLALVAEKAATDLGRERIRDLRPTADLDALRAHRRRFDDARRLLAGRPLVVGGERPLGPVLRALGADPRDLTGRDLVEIGHLLDVSLRAIERIHEADPPCAALAELCDTLPPVDDLRRLLAKTFDSRGEIREDATPKLAELRARIRSTRQRAYEQLSSMVDQHRDDLSEDTIPMRGGRLMLVLQSGSRGRIPGLVHGRSGSGRSFYFEPLEAVETNNQLQQSVEDEEAEKRRILRQVLDQLRKDLPALRTHAEWVAELDRLQASVRIGDEMEGRMADLGGRHELRLERARHPLLDPRLSGLRKAALGQPGHTGAIVPLDVELSTAQRALVVTGPNAGGKTVALKTMGLLCLAHQCGLPVPAEKGTRLPVLDALVATVGDDQDLLADRSTFSGRLLRLKEAWDLAGRDSLLLLDELGSGTDPEEGAALSTALLEGLLQRGGLVLVTTHLAQVAGAALEADGAFCAAMQFDGSTGEPTYRLLPGQPGGSEALALAHRLGLPRPWLDRAEALLGSEHRELRRLLAEVERHRSELAETRARLDTELEDAERLRERLVRREAELVEERQSVAKKLGGQLEAFRREVHEKLRAEAEKVADQVRGGRRKGLAAAATEKLFEQAPDLRVEPEETAPVEVGGTVRHKRLGWTGTLEKLERGKAQVDVGGKSLLCKEKDLVGVDPEKEKASRPAEKPSRGPSRRRQKVQVEASGLEEPGGELMLVGQRVEPALERLDRFLDKALLSSLGSVRVIHGHGSGQLRDAVRDHLVDHPAVSGMRPGNEHEGGDGATMVELMG